MSQSNKDDHLILHHDTGLSIKLTLDRILSLFDIIAPAVEIFCNGVCVGITLEGATWDPYDPLYSMMETELIDINGIILAPKYIHKILVEHNDEYTALLLSLDVVLADNICHNDMSNYAPGEACAISNLC